MSWHLSCYTLHTTKVTVSLTIDYISYSYSSMPILTNLSSLINIPRVHTFLLCLDLWGPNISWGVHIFHFLYWKIVWSIHFIGGGGPSQHYYYCKLRSDGLGVRLTYPRDVISHKKEYSVIHCCSYQVVLLMLLDWVLRVSLDVCCSFSLRL